MLLICSDQHTARVTGCYGDAVIETPNLDALAAEGTRFDSFYCNNPICCSSRMSFMTGRYSYRIACTDNQSILDSRIPTLAHIAVRGGYHAVISGKMHFNGPDQRHGFLERLTGELGDKGLLSGAQEEASGLRHLGNCSRHEPLWHTGAGRNQLVAYDDDVTESSVQWINHWGRKEDRPPFMMVAGYLLPHCPYIAPRELYDKYKDRVRAPRLRPEQWQSLHPHHLDYRRYIGLDQVPVENEDRAAIAYYALIDQMDRNIGRLVSALKESGQWDNTLVIYFSDHGEMLGRHGRWHKECFREDSARIPFIVRHPAGKKADVVTTPHSLVDLMPTLCEWAGVPPPPGLDGTSFQPALDGAENPDQTVKVETYTFWTQEQHGTSANRMIRKGPWKLCYYGAYDSYELFNLEQDPEEWKNLANDSACAVVMEELKKGIFSEGWSRDIVTELRGKTNTCGEVDNIKAYRDALRKSLREEPRKVDRIDYWPGSGTEATLLGPVGE